MAPQRAQRQASLFSSTELLFRFSRGFTLLEIMLVLLIVSIAGAVVIPELFSGLGPSLADESRRLQQTLRLAAEEAQIGGAPVRFVAEPDRYRFELLVTDPYAAVQGEKLDWQPIGERPLAEYRLPQGARIVALTRNGSHEPLLAGSTSAAADNRLGEIVMLPDGMLDAADLQLALVDAKGKLGEHTTLEVRPGPGGIRESKP